MSPLQNSKLYENKENLCTSWLPLYSQFPAQGWAGSIHVVMWTRAVIFKGVLSGTHSARLFKYLGENSNWFPNWNFLKSIRIRKEIIAFTYSSMGYFWKVFGPLTFTWSLECLSDSGMTGVLLFLTSWIRGRHRSVDILKTKGSNSLC